MRTLLLSLFALLTFALGARAQDAPALEANDKQISTALFEKWLVTLQGEAHARGFVRAWLVHKEAERAGLATTLEASMQRVEEVIQERVTNAFRGDRDAWRKELSLTGMEEGPFCALRAHVAAQELETKALVRAGRSYTDEVLRAEWERLFGRDGRTLQLRMIALDVPYGETGPNQTREQVNERRRQVEERALAGAMRLYNRLIEGGDFEQLASTESDDDLSREAGGLIAPGFDSKGFTERHINEVYNLKVGEITRPAIVRGRVLLLQHVFERVTSFEEGREPALASLQRRPVSTAEIDTLISRLRASAPYQVLPASYRPSGAAEEAVLKIGQNTITFDEYATWLRRSIGHSIAPQFLSDHLVQELAQATGLSVTQEAVEARTQELVVIASQQMFRGDLDAWAANLESQSKSRAMFERQTSHRARTSLLAEQALLKDRKFTELEVRELWGLKYGPNGRTQHVRLLVKLTAPPTIPEGITTDEAQRLRDKAKEDVRLQVLGLKARVEDGEDFASLARHFSDDEVSRKEGGLLGEPFATRVWPETFMRAVAALKIGHLTEPLFESGAWFLFELVDDKTVTFESVRVELEAEIKNSRPPALEVAVFLKTLLEASNWRVLPGMYE